MSAVTPPAVNWQKFALLLVAVSGMILLVLTNRVAWNDVEAPLYLIVGYATGNGITSLRGGFVSGVFEPRSSPLPPPPPVD